MNLTLGSGSKYRQEILRQLGYDLEVRIADIDEKSVRHGDPHRLPLDIALAKNKALQDQVNQESMLITADTVIIFNGKVREKPKDEAEAREFLRSYAGKLTEVVTGVVVKNLQTGKTAAESESAKVYFSQMPESVIDELIKHGAVLDAAGGFVAEMPMIRKYIVHIDGNMDNVMGLPKLLTKKLINEVSNGS